MQKNNEYIRTESKQALLSIIQNLNSITNEFCLDYFDASYINSKLRIIKMQSDLLKDLASYDTKIKI